jgi:hypothetical protein
MARAKKTAKVKRPTKKQIAADFRNEARTLAIGLKNVMDRYTALGMSTSELASEWVDVLLEEARRVDVLLEEARR